MTPLLRLGTALLLCILCSCTTRQLAGPDQPLHAPGQFSYVQKVIPDAVLDIRYFGNDNFTGRPVPGYEKPLAILTTKAASALLQVQEGLKKSGLGIKIFDAYRPQMAVDHFESWAKVLDDTLTKRKFYPDVDKRDLFKLNYIASRSGHTRGSTVDLTLIRLQTGEELDMGSHYDFFGNISHHAYGGISASQKANRELLRNIMARHGFRDYKEEWWHYTLADEPYPDTYFNFKVQ